MDPGQAGHTLHVRRPDGDFHKALIEQGPMQKGRIDSKVRAGQRGLDGNLPEGHQAEGQRHFTRLQRPVSYTHLDVYKRQGQMRPNRTMTRMSKYGIELYATLEAETGLATGWKQCGSVNVAKPPERM